ncbi:hypothetical protein B0H12DRAFT_1237549 [Mycena haematopus]|nr:hypothetical protein B0H12DRAFT_1237549 [Mycena haematopus]
MSDRKVIWIGTSHSRCNAWVDVGANEMIGGKHTTQMIHSARMWSMRHLYRLPPYCFPSSSPSRASALSSQPAPPPSTAKQEVSASYGAWFRWCGSTTTEDVLGHLKACGWALRICSSGGAPEMPYRSWRRWGSARAAGSLVAGQRVPEVGVSAASGWTAGTPSHEGACGEAYDVRRLDADEPPLGTEPEPQRDPATTPCQQRPGVDARREHCPRLHKRVVLPDEEPHMPCISDEPCRPNASHGFYDKFRIGICSAPVALGVSVLDAPVLSVQQLFILTKRDLVTIHLGPFIFLGLFRFSVPQRSHVSSCDHHSRCAFLRGHRASPSVRFVNRVARNARSSLREPVLTVHFVWNVNWTQLAVL